MYLQKHHKNKPIMLTFFYWWLIYKDMKKMISTATH